MRKIILGFFIIVLLFSLSVGLVFAWSQCDSKKDCPDGSRIEHCCPPPPPEGGLVPCGTPCCPCTFCDFFVMIDRIIDFVLIILVPALAALMIAIGGFMMISAYAGGGGPEMFSRAKTLFTAIVMGLVIIYGAWLVINLFLSIIGVAEWTGLKEGWWQIKCQ